jgi:threonine/homoserine/homoserine lactone efflux protein
MKKILILTSILTPQLALAASYTLKSFIDNITGLTNNIISVLIAVAIAFFFYNSGMGIFGGRSGDVNSQSKLKETLYWGIIIIFVMVSISGILNLISGELNLVRPR